MVKHFKYWVSLLMLQSVTQVFADNQPLLWQQIAQSKPNLQAVEKAKKQIADLNEIKLQDISLTPFHLRKKNPINDSAVYCTECHLPLPHQKHLRSRAFLNMHTDYLACETCHFRPEALELNYAWFDYQQHKVLEAQATQFRSGRKPDDKSPLVARDGKLKIVPMFQGEPVIFTKQDAKAKAIYDQWKAANLDEKAQLKAKLHAPLSPKGPECSACHISEVDAKMQSGANKLKRPLLNLTELGANAQQRSAIEQNTIVAFFAHYQPEVDDKNITVREDVKPQAGEKEQRIKITQFLK